ncbi:MAG: magnesium transporter [Candidatus Hydrogenedentes bacterium]|nr:magnesium transporter [Candidatus Hydrogenedentota bacterium]
MPDRAKMEPWDTLEALVAKNSSGDLHDFLETLSPFEVARAISRLSEGDQADLLTMLEPEDAADLIEELSDAQGADLMEDLSAEQAAVIVDEMESDERADLLGEMDEEDAEAILQRMDPEEAEEARQLLGHAHDTAGGLMVTEFVVYPQDLLVGEVLDDLRTNAEAYSDYGVQYAYVSSDSGALVGVLRLRDLVLSPNDKPVREVMIVNPVSVLVDAPLEELEQAFDRYQFSGLPVIAPEGKIVGVLQRADVEEAHSELTERTFMRFSGIIGGDELRSASIAGRSGARLRWLGINLVLSLVAASVIIVFQDVVDKVIALAALIPVLVNVSGCSGNQAVAVSIREMTLGLIRPRDFLRVVQQEVIVGVINGIVLGLLLGGFIFLWKDDWRLGLAVGLALALNTVLAVALGGAIPLILKRLHIDPAVAAAPILTTVVDMCGFFLILSLAAALIA